MLIYWLINWLIGWIFTEHCYSVSEVCFIVSLAYIARFILNWSKLSREKNEAGGWNRRGQSRLAALYVSLNAYSYLYIYIWRCYVHVFFGEQEDRNRWKRMFLQKQSCLSTINGGAVLSERGDVYHPRFPMEKIHRRFHVGRWRRHIRKHERGFRQNSCEKTCTLKWLKSWKKKTYSLPNLHFCVPYSLEVQDQTKNGL